MAEEAATGTREWARLWLSEERLVPYLETCGGDAGRAVELREWNGRPVTRVQDGDRGRMMGRYHG